MSRAGVLILSLLSAPPFHVYGQKAPPAPDKPWPVSVDARFRTEARGMSSQLTALDPNTIYTLPELVDIAERSNPETRVIWERAKARAAEAGIAHAALFPTIAAMASASINQYSLFFGKFYHEDTTLFPAALNLTYTVLDFGAREARIDLAKANLVATDFTFNNTHRTIVFEVAEAYYRLLDAMGQEGAARATLTDAETVQQAIEARLANGLATLPDALEARAAAAQARYELASIQVLEETAHGALATVLGVSPAVPFRVQDIAGGPAPQTIDEPVQTVMERTLTQRPDLMAQIANIRAADAGIRQARSAFDPVLSFSGSWGHTNAIGQQKLDPEVHSAIYPYQAQLTLNWRIFDGGARQSELARATSEKREAQAQAMASRDQIENEIWTSYSRLKTAQKQQEAAEALFEAANRSYSAAMEAFQAGVRTFLDVTSAQRDLARARTAQVTARVQLLTSMADLAFRAGDSIPSAQR
jgi:outer membrane protein TolC